MIRWHSQTKYLDRPMLAPILMRNVIVENCELWFCDLNLIPKFNDALEHLDLTIYIINGKLETDIFAKDIPIYLSRKSCHPNFVFKSVIKSTAIRLNQNCSLDEFLWERKSEYSRYFYASLYKPKEVSSIMDKCTGLTKNNNGEFVHGPARENRD